MKQKLKMILMMFGAAGAIGLIVYNFTDNWRIACAVGGLLLLTDLILVPKIMPHIFKDDEDKK